MQKSCGGNQNGASEDAAVNGGLRMGKYWNALRFGNAKTKRILWSVIGLFLLMIVGIVLAATGGGAVWG
ncbi:MAG: hypothetical protein K2N94_05460, partial [Lachnospiraceae bacterium]|nr:hypothetical protein [Lachnospiraceae bacterium]